MNEYYYENQIGVNPKEYSWNAMHDDCRQEFWKEQQQKYGFDERETWSLDHTFITWIYPRLKMLKDVKWGHPSGMTKDQWDDILNEMIDGFEVYLKESIPKKEHREKVNKSLELFTENFWGLWW